MLTTTATMSDRLSDPQVCPEDRHGVDGGEVPNAGGDPQRVDGASGQRLAQGTGSFERKAALGNTTKLETGLLELW